MFSDGVDDANAVHGSFFSKNLGNPALSVNVNLVQKTHLESLNAAFVFLDATWQFSGAPSG